LADKGGRKGVGMGRYTARAEEIVERAQEVEDAVALIEAAIRASVQEELEWAAAELEETLFGGTTTAKRLAASFRARAGEP
jgi:hypothetical protein